MKTRFFWSMIILLLFHGMFWRQVESANPMRVITGSNVRVRQDPNLSAAEVAKLALGTIVQELGRTSKQETIGNMQDYWYQISFADGQQGWIFGSFTRVYSEAQRDEIYHEITQARLSRENLNWFDQIDLARFLSRVSEEVSTPQIAAELKLARLRVLRQSLEPLETPPPEFEEWTQEQQESIYYGEIQDRWFVWSNLFWELHAEYQHLPISDEIAWEAAKNPTGGECEGYVPCHLSRINRSYGTYLSLYPSGEYASQALEAISAILQHFTQQKSSDYDRSGYLMLQQELKRLRSTIEATTVPEKNKVSDQLKQIAQLHLQRES